MKSEEITATILTHKKLWESSMITLMRLLAGEMYKSIRGVTLGFDGKVIEITVFFERKPTEDEVDSMQDIEAEFIAHTCIKSNLIFKVTPISENIDGQAGNWGWVYLRREA